MIHLFGLSPIKIRISGISYLLYTRPNIDNYFIPNNHFSQKKAHNWHFSHAHHKGNKEGETLNK